MWCVEAVASGWWPVLMDSGKQFDLAAALRRHVAILQPRDRRHNIELPR
jgi:hypothetical protein